LPPPFVWCWCCGCGCCWYCCETGEDVKEEGWEQEEEKEEEEDKEGGE